MPIDLCRLFTQSVARTPERTAIVDLDNDDRLTYQQLQGEVFAIANALRKRGIERGTRVAVCLKNTPEHAATFLATQFAGAVAVPFNHRLALEGFRYTLTDADSRLLIYGEDVREEVATLQEDLAIDEFVYVGDAVPEFATSFETLRNGTTEEPDVAYEPNDLSVIQYSSGTTGDPKGIQLDREATVMRVFLNSMGQTFRFGERMIGAMPLYHTVGLHGIFCNMMALSGTYLSMRQFDPARFVAAIDAEDVTAMHEAPTIYKEMLETDAIADADFDSIRVIAYSGAPMDSTLAERVKTEFDPELFSNQYGCTEAYAPLGQINLQKGYDPFITGPANVMHRTRIVEFGNTDSKATVESGEEGELIIGMESPTVFSGYWNKQEQTDEVVHDGWFYTGDVAYETGDGNVIITGRVDDMIISGGENLYPSKIEDVLASHPAVREAAVIGVPDDNWGETPQAFVVTRTDADEAELDQWCLDSDDLADFKRPRKYKFIDELPRNPSGKVTRYKLREMN